MAFITADRVKDTSTTTGTGNITVSGSAPFGYRTFSTVLSVSDTFYYAIQGQSTAEWEIGVGTYASTNQFARTTVLASSASNSAVSFSSGTKNVFITLAATRTLQLDSAGNPSFTGVLAIANGGTNTSATPTAGTIPYGTGTTLAYSAAGTAGQVLTSGGSGAPTWTTVTGTGTVTSVNVSGGTTGLTYSGGPITGSGTITMAGTLAVANGGTGVTTSTGSGNTVLSASPTLTGTVTVPTITSPTSTALTIQSAGTTAMTVDTSQNVGIGTSSVFAGAKLDIAGAGTQRLYVRETGSSVYGKITSSTTVVGVGSETNHPFAIFTNDVERARFNTSGILLLGTTSVINGSNATFQLLNTNGGNPGVNIGNSVGSSATNCIIFTNSNGTVGSIQTSGTATSYVTSSDYRLKNSIEPMTTGLATVSALKPVIYKWNVDNSDGEGFIAHELQSVIPHAVTGEKDAVDKDGNPVHQGVDYSKIVVHLVAAIQELSAKNDALEARLAALEVK